MFSYVLLAILIPFSEYPVIFSAYSLMLGSLVCCFKEAKCLLMWPQTLPRQLLAFRSWFSLTLQCHIDSLEWSERPTGFMSFYMSLPLEQLGACGL